MKPCSICKEHFLGNKYNLKDLINDKLFLWTIKLAFLNRWLGHGTHIR